MPTPSPSLPMQASDVDGLLAPPPPATALSPHWLIGLAEHNGTVVMGVNYASPGGGNATVGPYVSRSWLFDGQNWILGEEPLGGESTYALSISAIPTGFVSVAAESSLTVDSSDWKTFLSTDGTKWEELDIAVPAVNNAPVDETIASTPNGLLMVTQFLWDSRSSLAAEIGDVAIWASTNGINWTPTSIVNVEMWPRMVFGGELGAMAAIADQQNPGNAMILFSNDLTSWSIANPHPGSSDGVAGPVSGAVGRSSALLAFPTTDPLAVDSRQRYGWVSRNHLSRPSDAIRRRWLVQIDEAGRRVVSRRLRGVDRQTVSLDPSLRIRPD